MTYLDIITVVRLRNFEFVAAVGSIIIHIPKGHHVPGAHLKTSTGRFHLIIKYDILIENTLDDHKSQFTDRWLSLWKTIEDSSHVLLVA